MNDLSQQAQERGLTPELLEEILRGNGPEIADFSQESGQQQGKES